MVITNRRQRELTLQRAETVALVLKMIDDGEVGPLAARVDPAVRKIQRDAVEGILGELQALVVAYDQRVAEGTPDTDDDE